MAASVRELELDLDAFEGPFDLLLTLVLKDALEPAEIDIAAIVVAFVEHLAERDSTPHSWDVADERRPEGRVPSSTAPEGVGSSAASGAGGAGLRPARAGAGQVRGELDLEACGEFLVLVAALLELKARGLFPDEQAELSELEPEEAAEELARRLAEYRRMKEAAGWLRERLEAERDRYFRLGPAPLAPVPERRLEPQAPAVLADALRALAADPPRVTLNHMALRFPPVSQFVERFRALLGRRRRFDFDAEVGGFSRVDQAVAFLALLELHKAGEARLEQAAAFTPIRVSRTDVERTEQWRIVRSA